MNAIVSPNRTHGPRASCAMRETRRLTSPTPTEPGTHCRCSNQPSARARRRMDQGNPARGGYLGPVTDGRSSVDFAADCDLSDSYERSRRPSGLRSSDRPNSTAPASTRLAAEASSTGRRASGTASLGLNSGLPPIHGWGSVAAARDKRAAPAADRYGSRRTPAHQLLRPSPRATPRMPESEVSS